MTTAGEQLDPRRWVALAVCVSALFVTLLDVSIVAVALPSISASTGAGASELQWVVSGYALSFGMVPIIAGRLGDDRGRRLLLMVGTGAFVVTSALVGLAPNPEVLIAGRVLQGLAGGLINPQVSGILQQMFPPGERGKAFGVLGAAVGIATAAGPVVGGVIIGLGGAEYGWRLCFLVNVPIGVVVLVLCSRLLPRDVRAGPTRALDLPGAALLTVGVLGLLFPFVQFDASQDLRLAYLLLPAAAVLVGFVRWERGPGLRRGHPLVDLGLFDIRSYTSGVVLGFLFFCAYTGTPLVLALFLQDGLGFTPLQSGLTATAYAVGAAVSAPVGGRLLHRLGQRLLVGALVLFGVGVGVTAMVADQLAGDVEPARLAWFLAPALLLAGLGGGSVITPNQALALQEVDVRGGSTAGGTLQTAQRIGNAVGAAVITAVFYAAVSGGAGQREYGRAYALALMVSVAFTVLALLVAVRDVRRPART